MARVEVLVPRKRKKKQDRGVDHAGHTLSEVPETLEPPRIEAPSESSTPSVSRLALESSNGLVDRGGVEYPNTTTTSASRKKTKKDNEPAHGRRRSRKVKRGKAKEKSPARHHVRDGQIVTVSSEPEPGPESPTTPSASQPEEADSPARTPHHKGQENRAMKTPLSSLPKNLYHASSRRVTSSPTKEDVWNTISRGTGIWPELPRVFSQWDVQVTFLTSPSPGLSQRFSCCCRPVYPM